MRLANPTFAVTWTPAIGFHGATSQGATLFIKDTFAEPAGSCRVSVKSESQKVGNCMAESDVPFVERIVRLYVASDRYV